MHKSRSWPHEQIKCHSQHVFPSCGLVLGLKCFNCFGKYIATNKAPNLGNTLFQGHPSKPIQLSPSGPYGHMVDGVAHCVRGVRTAKAPSEGKAKQRQSETARERE